MKQTSKDNESAATKPLEDKKPAESTFPIVGIGASAGGLEALTHFFQNMPSDNGMAFVVIQHLDPDHVDVMPELLQRNTQMKVRQASDELTIEPNHVYIIPPNKSMSVLSDTLYLFTPIETRGLRLPIDFFFRSLADDRQERSIGIILSGMGSDGTMGAKAIKEKNGIVLVQDPQSAKFDGMPQSAISEGVADLIACAMDLPTKLIELLKSNSTSNAYTELENNIKNNLEKIILLIRSQTGHDFSMYKKNTLIRRIERRMTIHQIKKASLYVHLLQENPSEVDILFKELLIGVTNFFRDPAVWIKLKDQVFPDIFKRFPNGQALRAWVPGCSTGEEAYSLAIIFKEALEKLHTHSNFTLQIFATDLDSESIDVARKGVFPSNIVSDVSAERINNFFTPLENRFHIKTDIREMIVFASHNVIKDPPFTKLDLITCRNLLIYMESDLQKKLMSLFYYSLNMDGVMVLGSAESESSQNMLYTNINPKLKIYKRNSTAINPHLIDFPSSFSYTKNMTTEIPKHPKSDCNIQTITDQLLLQHFTPPSVLINEQGDLIYITGRIGKYLEPAAGKANMNIYAMAREGLNTHLITAIRKAKQNYEPVILRNLKMGTTPKDISFVDVTIQQINKPSLINGAILIVFSEVTPLSPSENQNTTSQPSANQINEAEIELKRVNEELQSTREEMQSSQEELKSSNEELQSTNEELQSTNEELTTSKEEMQSLNEELQTVNMELQNKISDYMQATNDLEQLLNSTDIATLFLDKELNIRRFTDHIIKLIKLRPSDIGRPFTEMVSDLQYPEIEAHSREVLRTLVYKEEEISTFDGRWFTVRIMPYRTLDDRIDGLVLTFIDITAVKKRETEQNETIDLLRKQNLA